MKTPKRKVPRKFWCNILTSLRTGARRKNSCVRRGLKKSPRRTGGPARASPQQAKRAAQSARPKAPGRQGAGPARTRGNGDPARGRGTAGRARRRSAGAARDRGRRSRPQGAKSRRRAATTLAPGRGPGRANEEGTRSPTSEPPAATAQDQRAQRAARSSTDRVRTGQSI